LRLGEARNLQTISAFHRFKTGIPELDEALYGGIPAKLTVAALNDPENDVSTFCQQFTWQGLQDNECCVYFTYDHHPEIVRKNMLRLGWDTTQYEERMDFILFDCYSARIGERGEGKYWLERPFETAKLLGMARVMERELSILKKNRPIRVILDSFTPLMEVLGFIDTLRFVFRLQGLAKKGNYMGLGIVHKGIHGTANEFGAKHASEGVIEFSTRLERQKLKQFIRVSKMSLTQFSMVEMPYIMTPNGIKVLKGSSATYI